MENLLHLLQTKVAFVKHAGSGRGRVFVVNSATSLKEFADAISDDEIILGSTDFIAIENEIEIDAYLNALRNAVFVHRLGELKRFRADADGTPFQLDNETDGGKFEIVQASYVHAQSYLFSIDPVDQFAGTYEEDAANAQ